MKKPKPKALVPTEPPRGNHQVWVNLNGADHSVIVEILKRMPVPGGTHRGNVSALFRHLERMIIEDWGWSLEGEAVPYVPKRERGKD